MADVPDLPETMTAEELQLEMERLMREDRRLTEELEAEKRQRRQEEVLRAREVQAAKEGEEMAREAEERKRADEERRRKRAERDAEVKKKREEQELYACARSVTCAGFIVEMLCPAFVRIGAAFGRIAWRASCGFARS